MGNDGGSIPKRRELVKEASRAPTASELKQTLLEAHAHLYAIDPLTSTPLSSPIVSDSLGRLFNKASIIEYLLPGESDNISEAKRAEQEHFLQGTVKSLKDIVEVKFEVDEVASEKLRGKVGPGRRAEVWVCPITREELGAGNKAVYLVPCGHAFSAAAVKEVSGECCLQCNEAYAANDVIPILPTVETDIARLTLRMKTVKEKGLAHSLKKAAGANKKRKKDIAEGVVSGQIDGAKSTNGVETPAPARLADLKESLDVKPASKATTPQPHSGTSTPKPANNINNMATASLTARVLEEQEARNKRRKLPGNEHINNLFTSKLPAGEKRNDIDFMNRGITLQK